MEHIPRFLRVGDGIRQGREGVRSVEGQQQDGPSQAGQQAQPPSPSSELVSRDRDRLGDRAREQYLDALFRDLDGSREERFSRRTAGYLLLGTGLVLIVAGSLGAVAAKASALLTSLVLAVNALAVLCVAAGLLLLPETPTSRPPQRNAGVRRGGFRLGRVGFSSSLRRLRMGRARH